MNYFLLIDCKYYLLMKLGKIKKYLRELNSRGNKFTIRYIQYHPGSPRHYEGAPYWKISSGKGGTQRFPSE